MASRRGRRTSRRPRRSLDELLEQVEGWDKRRPITEAQAEARLGKSGWRRVKAHLQQRGEARTVRRSGSTQTRIDSSERRSREWVRGLLKIYIHYRSQGVDREFEVEFDGIVLPRGITKNTEYWRRFRRRLMAQVESAVAEHDPVWANFVGEMPFADRDAAFEVDDDQSGVQPGVVQWDRTTIRTLSMSRGRAGVWQKTYRGGKVGRREDDEG